MSLYSSVKIRKMLLKAKAASVFGTREGHDGWRYRAGETPAAAFYSDYICTYYVRTIAWKKDQAWCEGGTPLLFYSHAVVAEAAAAAFVSGLCAAVSCSRQPSFPPILSSCFPTNPEAAVLLAREKDYPAGCLALMPLSTLLGRVLVKASKSTAFSTK